jgi:hypothetical protein
MEKQKNFTWDDIKAINVQTSIILQETNLLINVEKKRVMEEREEERKQKEEEKEERKREREKEKKLNSERKKVLNELKEYRKTHRDAIKRMKEIDIKYEKTFGQIGGISRSNGKFCEEYFINSFIENKTFLGEKFDNVVDYHKPLFPIIEDEYDLVMINGTTVVLIEVKYKADLNDVGKVFSKLTTYRTNYPNFKDYKIYLGLASFSFSKAVRDRAARDGIVLIRQRGEKIEVISENIRAW